MQAYRPDRVVKVLAKVVSIGYFGVWVLAAIALVGMLVLRLVDAAGPEWTWSLDVPAVQTQADVPVTTGWGTARLEYGDVRAKLKLPIADLPWSFLLLLWTSVAIGFGLMLLFLHHLRRIVHRVRDGAPFDEQNALRLRWLGLLLLGLAVFKGVADLVTTLWVRRIIAPEGVDVPLGLHFDVTLLFVGLVLVVLAEIFRRGSELETEQALVI